MNFRKQIRNIIFILTIIILIIMALGLWYRERFSMEEVATGQLHSENSETHILIATQGSDFKRAIVTNIENHFKLDTVFLKIIDVKKLNVININEYSAVIILHTWENGKPPASVTNFISNNMDEKQKFIVLATSGKGTNKIEGIDALSGESIVENASDYSDEIIARLVKILEPNLKQSL